MNTTSNPTPQSHFHDLAAEIFGPVPAPRGTTQRRMLLARSALAYVGLITTLVQIVVWLMIGILSDGLDAPWWLWTTVPAALGVIALTLADRWQTWWDTTADSASRS